MIKAKTHLVFLFVLELNSFHPIHLNNGHSIRGLKDVNELKL